MSKARAKGTAAETALVKWFRLNGYPGADRQPLRGNRDCGDLTLCPGVVVEVKNYNGTAGLGQPTAGMLTKWMAETVTERDNAGAAYCLLVVKRTGTTNPGNWWAYITVHDLLNIHNLPVLHDLYEVANRQARMRSPVCLTVDSLTTILRHNGYGTKPDKDQS